MTDVGGDTTLRLKLPDGSGARPPQTSEPEGIPPLVTGCPVTGRFPNMDG